LKFEVRDLNSSFKYDMYVLYSDCLIYDKIRLFLRVYQMSTAIKVTLMTISKII